MEWPAKSPGCNPINPNPNRAVLGEDEAKGQCHKPGVQSVYVLTELLLFICILGIKNKHYLFGIILLWRLKD